MNSFLKNILNKIIIDNKHSFKLTKKERNFLGLDIGTFSIKLVEVSENREKNEFNLLVADEIEIPQNETIEATAERKAEILSDLINKTKATSKNAIFTIGNAFTHYAIITLPILKNNKVSDYIKLNFNDVLPVDFADVHLEWNILEKKEGNMKILLIAVDNDIIKRYKQIARIAKVDFYSYEIEAKALLNSLIQELEKEKIIVILDVRMKNSSLSLVKNKKLIKSSSLEISVDYFNKNLKTEWISFSQKKKNSQKEREETSINNNNEDMFKKDKNSENINNKIKLSVRAFVLSKKIREIIKNKNKIEKEIWLESNIQRLKEKLEKDKKKKGGGNININFLDKELKTLKREKAKEEKNFIFEKKNYDEKMNKIRERRDILTSNLSKIEEREREINIELQKLEKAERNDDILKLRRKKQFEYREKERERWINEDKIEEINKKNEENKPFSLILTKKEEGLKKLTKKIKVLENKIKIEKDMGKLEIKNKEEIEEEINLLLREKGILENIEGGGINKKIAKTEEKRMIDVIEEYDYKSINLYFELFYKKIWLSIIGLKREEKQQLKKIIISGGADFIPDLVKYLQKRINEKFPIVKVEIANPFANISTAQLLIKPKKSSQFSNAVGAALKGFKK